MNPETWVASGHIGGFSDPLMDCKECKSRHRADKLIEDFAHEKGEDITVDGWSKKRWLNTSQKITLSRPKCGKQNFTDIREFNLMFQDIPRGVTEDSSSVVYLRPETAQRYFRKLQNVQRTSRKKYLSASDKSVNHSETKSHRVTSHSVQENLNKWNLNFSVHRVQTLSGTHIGKRILYEFLT